MPSIPVQAVRIFLPGAAAIHGSRTRCGYSIATNPTIESTSPQVLSANWLLLQPTKASKALPVDSAKPPDALVHCSAQTNSPQKDSFDSLFVDQLSLNISETWRFDIRCFTYWKLPFSIISRAALMVAVIAWRASAPPTLTRLTPAAS